MATQTPTIITQGTQAQDGSGVNKYNPNTGNLLLPGQSVSINPPTIPAGIALGSTQPLPTQPKQNNAIVTNANANINGYLEQQPLEQQVNNNLQTTQQEYQSANQSYQQGILDLINNRQQKVSDLQGQTGFTKASMDYNQATAKINSLDQQAALERKATLENRSLTLEDQQRRLNALEITNTINKTDALIDYNIKKGSYDAIKELTDQKINIMMQDDAMRIDALKTQKEDLKGFFTSAQDKQFNVMIKKQEQAFQEKQDKLKFQQSLQLKAIDFSRDLQKLGLEKGLTYDQIKGVKSYADLAKVLGTTTGDVIGKITDTQQLSTIDKLLTKGGGKGQAVGANPFTRATGSGNIIGSGKRKTFVTDTENILSSFSLGGYIDAKKAGATFGALSQGEMNWLQNSANGLNQAKITEDGKPDGKVIGYDIPEETYNRYMQQIADVKKATYERKYGVPYTTPQDPAGLGINTAQLDPAGLGI